MRRALLLLACLASLPAWAVDFSGQGRVWGGAGVDTNPGRDVVLPDTPTNPSSFAFLNATLEGAATGERARGWATYDAAGRVFEPGPPSAENTIIQNLAAEVMTPLLRTLSGGLTTRLRDRRGSDREYSDLLGEVALDLVPDSTLSLRLEGGAHRFLFREGPYSFSAPTGTLSVRYRASRRHVFSAFGNFEPRTFNSNAHANPADPEPPPPVTRKDAFFVVGAAYAYKGPIILTLGYSYLDSTSNSYGETLRRHRITATVGVRLPWRLTLMGTGALQLANYPEGIYSDVALNLTEDDENASSITVKLVRPLGEQWELDLRYALYGNNFPVEGYVYRRQLATLGLTFLF